MSEKGSWKKQAIKAAVEIEGNIAAEGNSGK
jgi:hypothetical protein